MPIPSDHDITSVIGKIPYRMAFAGGWIDQPFVSMHNPTPPGSMVVVGIRAHLSLHGSQRHGHQHARGRTQIMERRVAGLETRGNWCASSMMPRIKAKLRPRDRRIWRA